MNRFRIAALICAALFTPTAPAQTNPLAGVIDIHSKLNPAKLLSLP
jgi:hypothetical protein